MPLLRRLFASRLGSVAGTAAILLPLLFAGTALAVEYGNGLLTKSDNQRVADAAAYAAAVYYSQTNSTTGIQAAINRVAQSSGLSAASLTYSVGTSPRGNGNTAITVTATTSVPLYFTQIISSTKTLSVVASSNAEIVSGGPGCIFALAAGGTGVTMSGGTSMSAPSCIVQSNNTVTAPCGTTIKALQIIYNSASAPSQPCGGLQKADGTAATLKKAAVTDPLSGNAQVAAHCPSRADAWRRAIRVAQHRLWL
jgi:Flp pilus assembly protein TadG